MLIVRLVVISIIAVCFLGVGNAASDDFLPKEVRQCVEEFVRPPVEPKDCPRLSDMKTIKVLDLPDSTQKVKVEIESDPNNFRVSLMKRQDNAGLQEGVREQVEKSVVISAGTISFDYGEPRVFLSRVGKIPVILLDNVSGGNCPNGGTFIVVSLEADNMLHVVGTAVPTWWDDNEPFELIYFYDILGLNPWVGGSLSPYVRIYLKISNGKLTPDKEKCIAKWKSTILKEEGRLREKLLLECGLDKIAYRFSFILEKLLIDYLNGKGEEAWLNFQTNLKPLLDKNGELVTHESIEKAGYTSTEIEDYLRKKMSGQCKDS